MRKDQFDADKLDQLAAFLGGFDDEAADDARKLARESRARVLTKSDDLQIERWRHGTGSRGSDPDLASAR